MLFRSAFDPPRDVPAPDLGDAGIVGASRDRRDLWAWTLLGIVIGLATPAMRPYMGGGVYFPLHGAAAIAVLSGWRSVLAMCSVGVATLFFTVVMPQYRESPADAGIFIRFVSNYVILLALAWVAWWLARDRERLVEQGRQLAAAERRSSLERRVLSSILTTSPAAIVAFGSTGEIAFANPAADRLLRLVPDDQRRVMPAHVVLGADGTPWPSDVPGPLQRFVHAPTLVADLRFGIQWQDGTDTWFDAHAAPLALSGVDAPTAVAVLTDVSGVVQRDRVLGEAREAIERAERLDSVGRLAGGIAHDFNNLLTVILAQADLALNELPPGSPNASGISEILDAATTAKTLTRRLLDFSRRQVIAPRAVELDALLRRAARLVRSVAGDQVVVTLDLATQPAVVRVDPSQIEQALLNLAANARDAMPDGGTLTIRSRRIAGTLPLLLEIEDTGSGMAPDVLARAFDPYFTTKAVGHGTGLGLAAAHGVVSRAGGEIAIRSEPGAGTTVTIRLPEVDAAAEAADDPEAPDDGQPAVAAVDAVQVAQPSGPTILVVDDNEMVGRATAALLRREGFRVFVAQDGVSARALAAEHRPDLLISDVVMPVEPGPVLANALRELYPGLPVLFVSGYPDEAVFQHGALTDDVAILGKPYTRDALATQVRRLLNEPKAGTSGPR